MDGSYSGARMAPDDLTSRWVDALSALRAEHLARLHAFRYALGFAALGLAVAGVIGVLLALDPLWDLSLADSDLGWPLFGAATAAVALAGCLTALALRQVRRDRGAAIAALDRAIPQLLDGAEPRLVLAELSERMKQISPPRADPGATPYLPSLLEGRSLGTSAYTKMWLAVALILLAALLLVQALVGSVPPAGDETDDGGPMESRATYSLTA